ncbi:thiazole synthase [Geobacter sp. OR-1]|uniref:sulfur carrier protein ThiS n=1 Tax=Geobacter sp. OR-1 TaxID=1266765 RepID=UPI000544362C|nr:sulfur carrier protein ThiS [Geobacter sp. OR-1]GAM08886.1 thiazole synthase [Geobacter sp. OR-1]
MRLSVNGEVKETGCSTVSELLQSLQIEPGHVAVELNLAIIPKQQYETMTLNDGDRIEIVHFVGGG